MSLAAAAAGGGTLFFLAGGAALGRFAAAACPARTTAVRASTLALRAADFFVSMPTWPPLALNHALFVAIPSRDQGVKFAASNRHTFLNFGSMFDGPVVHARAPGVVARLMATFTPLTFQDGTRLAGAHGLGNCHSVHPIAAGTVNSNYFLDTDAGRVFVRIYEQQEVDGVAYEWQLLDHLTSRGVPVPPRIHGPGPGEARVGGKPVALFRAVAGEDLCQARVTPERCHAVGVALARASRAGQDFPVVREGRFKLSDVARLLESASQAGRPEIAQELARLKALHAELEARIPAGLARGVVHGDLFRDNVLWQGSELVALLDWESASDGIVIYDLAVTMLAWCCGDTFDFALARAMVEGYRSERELPANEWVGLWWMMRLGCLRFATTRITDVYLRGTYPEGYKSFRRFLLRLSCIEAHTPEQVATLLGA